MPMAARVKKGVHLRGKSYSAPSTPGRTFLPDGRQMTADSPNIRSDIPTAQEKPVPPNYLKPTVSSGHDCSSRRYGPKSQPHEDPVTAAAARKRLLSTKSMEKPASPPSLPHKTSKEKIVPEKASKVPTSGKTLTRAKSFPKNMLKIRSEVNGSTSSTTSTSAIKLEQEDKVLSIDSGVQGHAARRVSRSPKSNSDGKHWTTTTEKMSDIGKPGAPRVKVMTKVSGNGVPRKLKGRELGGEGKVAVGERLIRSSKQSGEGVLKVEVERKTERENLVLKWKEVREKDAPPSCNDAIEETATKMAMRRGNVKALVGTFESVIVLQEPQSQPSQQQEEEVVVKVGRVGQPKPEKEVKVGEEDAGRGDQPRRMKPAEKEKEVEGGEDEFAKRGSTAKQQPKKEVKNEEESSEGGHLGQETRQKETKGEEENGIEAESKRGQLGQESQQKGAEEEESKREEDGEAVL